MTSLAEIRKRRRYVDTMLATERLILRHRRSGLYFRMLITDQKPDFCWTADAEDATDFLNLDDAWGACISRRIGIDDVTVVQA